MQGHTQQNKLAGPGFVAVLVSPVVAEPEEAAVLDKQEPLGLAADRLDSAVLGSVLNIAAGIDSPGPGPAEGDKARPDR